MRVRDLYFVRIAQVTHIERAGLLKSGYTQYRIMDEIHIAKLRKTAYDKYFLLIRNNLKVYFNHNETESVGDYFAVTAEQFSSYLRKSKRFISKKQLYNIERGINKDPSNNSLYGEKKMEKIASFSVDHNKLNPGMYVSRIDGSQNTIVTYDLRVKKPNAGSYMDCAGMHTIEHLAATLFRNSPIANNIIYFGGMFCRTGFYLIVEDVEDSVVVNYTKEVFERIANWSEDIPGKSAVECGNYLDHNLEQAREYAKEYCEILKNCSEDTLKY